MTESANNSDADNSNFVFLAKHEPLFFQLGSSAERLFSFDPNASLLKLRQLGEAIAQSFDDRTSQSDLLYAINRQINLDTTVRELFHTLRIEGNRAAHEFSTTFKEAMDALKVARQLAIWYHRAFNKAGDEFKPGQFRAPTDPTSQLRDLQSRIGQLQSALDEAHVAHDGDKKLLQLKHEEATQQAQLAQQMDEERRIYEQLALEAEAELVRARQVFNQHLVQQQVLPLPNVQEAVAQVRRETQLATRLIRLSEEETRILIDKQLRERGWEVDTVLLDYRRGARPEAGKNKAIAEWPCFNPHDKKDTRADYVLFFGFRPVATVEAKRFGNDVVDDLRQAEEYSRDIRLDSLNTQRVADGEEAYRFVWPIDDAGKESFKVPFAFSTNGREFQHQIATKSGVWFRDLRNRYNKSRALMGWPTPTELLADLNDAVKNPALLDGESFEYMGLYPFQEKAVLAAEQAIRSGQRKILIAMATGTGKTRTTIGLMYRLLKARMFNRILFLVDRNTLGTQAQDAFKDMRLEANQSFAEIYDVKELSDQAPESKTKVQVATVQAMVGRVFDADVPIPIRQYDCIVVDEAHRGYTLDRDMTEGEMELRDFNDYVSAYRRVLDYFDAVRIGLTATPAAHTVEIFGHPTFTYSYREAVIDGYLIDYEPPYTLETRLSTEGIHFDAGEQVSIVNSIGQTRTEDLPDELDFEVDAFNRSVLNSRFNEVVCDELAKNHLDPTGSHKTLIFCISDEHADAVVKCMESALDKYHGTQRANTVMKITGSIRNPQGAIREFRNESIPNIAVTVDLLTTGVDIPKICNLVFMRRVRSRILYEQMKGRATRLCKEIEKDVFRIFDCVRLYEVLQPVDTMRPVVQQVNVSLEQLIADLNNPASYTLGNSDGTHADSVHDQLLAKLQRLVRRAKDTQRFADAAEKLQVIDTLLKNAGQPRFTDLPQQLKADGPQATGTLFAKYPKLLPLIAQLRDALRFEPGEMVISSHDDSMVSVGRGYGSDEKGQPLAKPEDYLLSFDAFVRDNVNKITALKVVTTKPRDLTREDLKNLRLLLAEQGFDETRLRAAWKDARNEDIAASIIGYIRQAAMRSPLVPFDERVNRAVSRIRQTRKLSPNQDRWLERLAAQLKREVIIDNTLFDAPAFRQYGGRQALEAQFPGEVDTLLDQLTTFTWEESA
jgi:type I restriction enzyme R subunit